MQLNLQEKVEQIMRTANTKGQMKSQCGAIQCRDVGAWWPGWAGLAFAFCTLNFW